MIKKLFFLSTIFAIPAIGMENVPKITLRSWVEKTSRIYVRTDNANYTGDIADDSTIEDLKEEFEIRKGIPAEQQQICAVWLERRRNRIRKWHERASPYLQNQDNIKYLMSIYNTNMFQIYVTK
ncbi:MAG TPA: hypothetical protein VGW78_04165 [Candidatus Babeliales bacterium]|jgi:hypothetical protein|nr:hypothetical protein [Candidatus Babeliales bacterium]